MLILSDLHIGKTAHFRKAGIAVPQQVFQEDMHRLYQQIHHFNPSAILITGDLFHSHTNIEHDVFAKWRKTLGSKEMILVRGNHDRLSDEAYHSMGIHCAGNTFELQDFVFIHEMPSESNDSKFYFTGHQHPGIKISGKGKQSMTLPCFYFNHTHAVLPAFSRFTGKHIIELQKDEFGFVIMENDLPPGLMRYPTN